ncbi:hypothetical protein V6N11_066461 [Hibiscus sabdariffa]
MLRDQKRGDQIKSGDQSTTGHVGQTNPSTEALLQSTLEVRKNSYPNLQENELLGLNTIDMNKRDKVEIPCPFFYAKQNGADTREIYPGVRQFRNNKERITFNNDSAKTQFLCENKSLKTS